MDMDRLKKICRALYRTMIVVAVFVAALLLYVFTSRLPGTGDRAQRTPAARDKAAEGVPKTQDGEIVMREDLLPGAQSFYKRIDAEFYTVSGGRVALSSYRGRPLVLLYWASWCPDCQGMMREIEGLATAAEAAGAQFVMVARTGINGETAETAASYLAENDIKRATLLDRDAVVYSALDLRWVPTVLYFSPGGSLMHADIYDFTAQAATAGVEYANGGAAGATARFILNNLLRPDGGIAANFTVNGTGDVIRGDEALTETTGLMLLYAQSRGDKQLFDRLLAFVDAYSQDGRMPWQVKDGKTGTVNSTLDDLRIIEALMAAEALWGGYGDRIREYALSLAQYAAPDRELRDFFDLESGAAARMLTLCYADIKVLKSLGKRFAQWEGVADNAQNVLDGGYLRDEFALYMPRYDYEKKAYTGDFLHMNEALVTAYNLAKQRALPRATLAYLKRCLEAGPIYAGYGTDGLVAAGYAHESTASYALLALIATELGDGDLLRLSLRRMEKMRILHAGSVTDGAYIGGMGAVNYTFDSVLALLAWDAAGRCAIPGISLD